MMDQLLLSSPLKQNLKFEVWQNSDDFKILQKSKHIIWTCYNRNEHNFNIDSSF